MTKRYVYDYCNKCGQATPHTVVIVGGWLVDEEPPVKYVKARCNWCGSEIEVEYVEE